MKNALTILVLLAAVAASGPAPGMDLVREFKGERSQETGEFEVTEPWILDWRVTGEYAEEMGVDVSLVRSGTNIHEGSVLKTRSPGNGVRLFDLGGRFFFRIDSTFAGWTLKVYQLTPEEAKEYTPKTSSLLDH